MRSRCPANVMNTPPSSRLSSHSTMFMAGEPMNPATNRFAGSSYRVCGVSTCCSWPFLITATRSPIVMASTWSCVTYSVVTPSSCWIRAISVRIWTRSFASRFESGSSMRNAFGSRTIARPIATRCRWPPESAFGLRSRNSSRPRMRAASRTRRSISSFGSFRSFSPNPMLSYTFMCGYSA